MGKRVCRVRYPTLRVIDLAVRLLRARYPGDPIEWKGGGRGQAEAALAAARWAFQASRGRPCSERKLAAAAALFYELITLHPWSTGTRGWPPSCSGPFSASTGCRDPGR